MLLTQHQTAARYELGDEHDGGYPALTPREIEVLALIARGHSKAGTAARLGIATGTVNSHLARIFRALAVHKTAHAVAIAYCRGVFDVDRRVAPTGDISVRELDVLRGIALGMTDAQVGVLLSVSRETVKSHLRRIYLKLGVRSRVQAVDAAFRCGLLELTG